MTTYRTVVFDGPYLTRRSFEAGRSEQATGAEALWGASTSVLLQFALDHPEAEVVVAWEPPPSEVPCERKCISEDYKARRKAPPVEYLRARDEYRELVTLLGFAQVWCLGLEADDAIASVVATVNPPTLIWTADKDLLQLVGPGVHMIRPTSGPEIITPENIVSLTGHTAQDWRSILILAGDPTDGIAGLPRVGKERAERLVASCPDIVAWVLEGTPEARAGAEAVVAASDPKALQWVEVAFAHRELVVEAEALVRLRVAPLETTPGARDLGRAVDWLVAAGLGYLERKVWALERDPWLEEESTIDPWNEDSLPF
jgi:5'-3' exonuclease